ncbi:MAG TPA: DnaJ domain-containing protein [Campylobacter avium]|uniref:DnaJ domain-containing protein n=1 Tax=Campylobacter avium TaxID=522485 RepID=UPI001DECB8F0|nr:DnaJ domain-containing protein [Campylobacter avium]HJE65787.1 DnaJ domain-containing protein [Campylobacter avium]
MSFILILLAILAFYWYFKTWGKNDVFSGVKGFAKGFKEGMIEERIDEYKKRMNYYVIALLAKIAKSDGRVSENEADMISQILDANARDKRERDFLKATFNEHKDNINDVFMVAREFTQEVPLAKKEFLNVLNLLVFMAFIDGEMNAKKEEMLKEIARAFCVSEYELKAFIEGISSRKNANSKAMSLDEAYKILELDKNASLNELKKRYRELAKKYHPDILNANNVSKEELERGVERFHKINEAYELIKKNLS